MARTPMRACLDMATGEGGRIVIASDWLHFQQTPPLPAQIITAALIALAHNRTYRSPNGAWSLTPLED
jgi:hypothetical protein